MSCNCEPRTTEVPVDSKFVSTQNIFPPLNTLSFVCHDPKCPSRLLIGNYTSDFPMFRLLQISRYHWNEIAKAISDKEHAAMMVAPTDKFITLRLDGHGFSNKMKTLRKLGTIPKYGFSDEFHTLMVNGMMNVCQLTAAMLGYTQSDEMTLVLPALPMDDTKTNRHPWGGKRDKLISLVASRLSVFVTLEIQKWNNVPKDFVVEFDCRLAIHDTFLDALKVIEWRAYDGLVNGISDTVYHSEKCTKASMTLTCEKKIGWLVDHGLWPPSPQRLYGTVVRRETITKAAVNQQTGEPVVCERRIMKIQDRKEFCLDDFIST